MFKKLSVIFIVLALFIFCKGNNETANENIKQSQNITSVDSLLQFADSFVGKTVATKGMVSHVCRVSGKKLFIIGENPQHMIKVTTGRDISQFDIALEGSHVLVKGEFVKQLVDVRADNHDHHHEQTGQDKVACATEELALYSIECSSFKEL